jgi:small redox-active disulfide protein 2
MRGREQENRMDIKVLGMGCARCHDLEKRVHKALVETGVTAEVEKVADIQKIMAYKVVATPGLVIDGTVKSAGHLPSVEEIKGWLQETKNP